MRNIVTKHAREILGIIHREHNLQLQRAAGGHIRKDQVEQCVIERLCAIGKNNPGVRAFLTYNGPIPKSEDEDPNVPWAEDPRIGRGNVVRHTSGPGSLHPSKDFENDPAWPGPGERIA